MGSTATLIGGNTATPSFTADVAGTYMVNLVVTDEGGLLSDTDQVEVSSGNMSPTSNAGPDQLVIVDQPVVLDGTESSDPEGDELQYKWSVVSKPIDSSAMLTDDAIPTPTFVPDLEGTYEISLTVSDLIGPAQPDTVAVTATTAAGFAETKIVQASTATDALSSEQVTTKGNKNALLNFLQQAVVALQGGDIDEATSKLEKAMSRTDGCCDSTNGCSLDGSPDGNGPGRDWITDCEAQGEIYNLLKDALDSITP